MLYGDYLDRASRRGRESRRSPARRWRSGRAASGSPTGARSRPTRSVLAPGNFRPATPPGIDPAALGPLWVDDPWAGRPHRGARRRRRAAADRHRAHRGRRRADPRRHRLSRPDRGAVAARPRAARARHARAERGAARGAAAGLRGDAAPGARAERRDRLAQRRARAARRHQRALGAGERGRAPPLPQAFARLVGRPPPQGRARGRRDDRGDAGRGPARHRRRQAGLGRGGRRQGRWSAFVRAAADAVETLRVARIVNCTGPELDIVRAGEPLLDALLAAGRIRPDPLAIGIDVDPECRAIGADGSRARRSR